MSLRASLFIKLVSSTNSTLATFKLSSESSPALVIKGIRPDTARLTLARKIASDYVDYLKERESPRNSHSRRRSTFNSPEEEGLLMRKLLFLICVLGMPAALWAQTSSASWENLNTLQAGAKIQVVEMNSKKVSGTFVSVSEAAITLQGDADQQAIQRQDVRIVKLMEDGHRGRNALIGGAVGAGVGAGIAAASWENHGFTGGKGTGAAVGAVIGFAGGAVTGVLLPSHKTIYRVSAH